MLRVVVLLAALAVGYLAFAYLRRDADLPSEVAVLSTYRSLDGANKRQRLLPHAGVDFGGPLGSPVIAAADGVVSVGEEVARGRIIGRMGMSGNELGVSHVHFELCTSACRSHADGDLAGTADPLKLSAGCFDPEKAYPLGQLALTYPIPCGGAYRER